MASHSLTELLYCYLSSATRLVLYSTGAVGSQPRPRYSDLCITQKIQSVKEATTRKINFLPTRYILSSYQDIVEQLTVYLGVRRAGGDGETVM